jgi:hypothetical protein
MLTVLAGMRQNVTKASMKTPISDCKHKDYAATQCGDAVFLEK